MLADCAKRDPEVSEDTEKNFAELLTEELKLREAEALENQRRADMALLEAKKMTSQYQKEADKCNLENKISINITMGNVKYFVTPKKKKGKYA